MLPFLELALVEKFYFFYGTTSLDPHQHFKTLKTISGVGLRWVIWIILIRFIVFADLAQFFKVLC